MKIMGILNVTPDSFSDGGRFHNEERAVARAHEMLDEGADIIDVGGESSRPGAEPLTAEEEWWRIGNVIEDVARWGVQVSVDTYRPEVAQKALEAGASMVNDITGLADERMVQLVAEHGCEVVVMHMRGTPKNMQEHPAYEDVVDDISAFFEERITVAQKAGIKRKDLILDPGIGFGKTVAHNLELIKRIDDFKELGCRVLLGASRKSFIGAVTGAEVEHRLPGSLAVAVLAVERGVDVLRVHDVSETIQAVELAEAVGEGISYGSD